LQHLRERDRIVSGLVDRLGVEREIEQGGGVALRGFRRSLLTRHVNARSKRPERGQGVKSFREASGRARSAPLAPRKELHDGLSWSSFQDARPEAPRFPPSAEPRKGRRSLGAGLITA